MGFTNSSNLSLPIAVFLASDSYPHDETVLSVTKLIKPVRELILTDRVQLGDQVHVVEADILQQYKSRVGTAIHHYIETVWKDDVLRNSALEALGIPEKTRKKILVNPTGKVPNGSYPIYLEHTGFKDVLGYNMRGTADVIFNGRLGDFKKTSPLSYKDEGKNHKYHLQGSLYKYIMPDLIKDDHMDIFEMYEEWTRYKAGTPDYPPAQVVQKAIPLMDIGQTDRYVKGKINLINKLYDAPDSDLPECTDQDLWRGNSVYKYYKDPNKRTRSTANFDNFKDAMLRQHQEGNVGVVEEVKAKAKACHYCDAFPICQQARSLEQQGLL